MPYENYHTARLKDPDQFEKFRTFKPKNFPEGISVIVGIKDGEEEFQSIRADKNKMSLAQFKTFLKENNFKTSGLNKSIELFSTWLPLGLVKSEEEGRTKIGGIISTDTVDQQGDMILQEGMDFSYFLDKGYFNYEHKGGVEYIVGAPTKVERVNLDGKQATRVEGYLMTEKPLAKTIIETCVAMEKAQLDRKIGFSVEGQVVARDPVNPKVITKAKILNVAITSAPVNPDAQLEFLARSLMNAKQIAKQILEAHPEIKNKDVMDEIHKMIMEKSIGYQTPAQPAPEASLSPLVPQSLEEKMSIQDFGKEMEKTMYERLKSEMEKMMGERIKMMLMPQKGHKAPQVSTNQIKDVMMRVFPQLGEKKARQLALNLVNSAKSYYNA